MKPLAIACSILTACLLTVAGPGWAELDANANFMTINDGLISTAYDANCRWVDLNTFQTLHLFIHDPVNPSFGYEGSERAVENIGGFECNLTFSEGAHIVSWSFAVPAINSGTIDTPRVEFLEPLPVTYDYYFWPMFEVATIEVFFGGPVGFEIPTEMWARCIYNPNIEAYLRPAFPATVVGSVSYTDADDPFEPVIAAQCSGDNVDLYFQMVDLPVVATERSSWDALKSLYR